MKKRQKKRDETRTTKDLTIPGGTNRGSRIDNIISLQFQSINQSKFI